MGTAVLARRRAVSVAVRLDLSVLAVLGVPVTSLIPLGDRGVRTIVVVASGVADAVVVYAAVDLFLGLPFLGRGMICRRLRGRLRTGFLGDDDVRNTTGLYSILTISA